MVSKRSSLRVWSAIWRCFRESRHHGGDGGERLSHGNEGFHDADAHTDGNGAVQDSRKHGDTLFRERIRSLRREAEPVGVVTVCDNLPEFLFGQLETETRWKPVFVALDRLVERPGFDLVQIGQIRRQHHLHAANGVDARLDEAVVDEGGGEGCRHRRCRDERAICLVHSGSPSCGRGRYRVVRRPVPAERGIDCHSAPGKMSPARRHFAWRGRDNDGMRAMARPLRAFPRERVRTN